MGRRYANLSSTKMKTTIQFYKDADQGHVMDITTDDHSISLFHSDTQSFRLGIDDRHQFGDDKQFWIHQSESKNSQTANMLIGDASMSCKITKHTYLFLKSIDLNKFVKLELKVEFDSEDDVY